MRRLGLLCSFLLLGACDAPGGGTLPPPPQGPYGEVVSRLCEVLDRCPEGFGRPIHYRSREECVAIVDWAVSCRLTEEELPGDVTVYGVARRMIEVDEAQAEACLEWLASASCEELATAEDTPCSQVIVTADDDDEETPTGPAGLDEPCESDEDCERELFCLGGDVDRESGVVTCRVCRPRVGEGADCSSARCLSGLYCRVDSPATPTVYECVPPEPDGTRCYGDNQCASGFCNTTLDDLGGWGRCDPGGNPGDACDERFDCREGLTCDGTCQRPRENGEPCSDPSHCRYGNCDESDQRCGYVDGASCWGPEACRSGGCVDGICGPGTAGGSCYGDEQCPSGQVCSFDLERCLDPQPDGAGCDRDEECASGYCTFDDVCATRPALGDPCSYSAECDARAYCQGGVCVERLAPGAACDALESCLEPFICREGVCQLMNLRCEPARAGEMCAMFRVCDASSYCDLLGGITCRPRVAEGQPCSPSPIRGVEVCAVGLACVSDASGTTACRPRAAIGEPCGDAGCIEGATCAEGTCRETVIGPPCDWETPCPSGMYCHEDIERCVPVGGEGAACDDTSQCDAQTYCDFRTCVPRHGVGEECYDADDCRPELYCMGYSNCQPDLREGSPCDAREEPCEAGTYCPIGVVDPVCTRAGDGGTACSSNEQCASGVCYSYDICLASPECVAP